LLASFPVQTVSTPVGLLVLQRIRAEA